VAVAFYELTSRMVELSVLKPIMARNPNYELACEGAHIVRESIIQRD
jgi:hypothetical protein